MRYRCESHRHLEIRTDDQFICFGYDQGVLSSLLTLPSFIETFPETASGFGSAQSLLVAICTSVIPLDGSELTYRPHRMHVRSFVEFVRRGLARTEEDNLRVSHSACHVM